MKLKTIFLLVVLSLVPCFGQDFSPPEDAGFFPIGWSENGEVFAFGWFATSIMINNSSHLQIVIQNLVTDEVLWQGWKDWEESNVGGPEDTSPPAPRSPGKAWELYYETAGEVLSAYEIMVEGGTPFSSSPLVDGDSLRAELVPVGEDPEMGISAGTFYEVFAYSSNRGEKRISGGEVEPGLEMEVAGYVVNPHGSRMAVVLRKIVPYISRYPTYEVIGCHLRAGFEAPMR